MNTTLPHLAGPVVAPAPAPVAPAPGLSPAAEDDLDQLSLPDACRALEFASRLARQARDAEAAPDHALRDQIAALLDQACPEPKSPAL